MLRIKEILIFIILLSFMNISNIYSAGRETGRDKAHAKLIHAISLNNPVPVASILDTGADINYRDAEGRTPLIIAAQRKSKPSVIQLLLDRKANPDIKDASGKTYKDYLEPKKSEESKKSEVKKEEPSAERTAQIQAANKLLWDAIEKNKIEQAKEALKNGADINTRNRFGETPLTAASYGRSNDELIKLLLEHKADVNAQDEEGKTALIYASLNNRIEIIKLLIEKGANVNVQDIEGNTALLSIANKSYSYQTPIIVEMLLNNGANEAIKNNEGKSFLTIAHDKPELQKVVNEYNEYKQKLQEQLLETFPKDIAGIIGEYAGSIPERKPAEKV